MLCEGYNTIIASSLLALLPVPCQAVKGLVEDPKTRGGKWNGSSRDNAPWRGDALEKVMRQALVSDTFNLGAQLTQDCFRHEGIEELEKQITKLSETEKVPPTHKNKPTRHLA